MFDQLQEEIDLDKLALEFFNHVGLCHNISGHWYDWEIVDEISDENEIVVRFICGIDEEGHQETWSDTKTFESGVDFNKS